MKFYILPNLKITMGTFLWFNGLRSSPLRYRISSVAVKAVEDCLRNDLPEKSLLFLEKHIEDFYKI